MSRKPHTELRRGWTTGACATAATRAALIALMGNSFPKDVQITLPNGETPVFKLAQQSAGEGWCEVGIVKDAGDDPDVTHGALIVSRVCKGKKGVKFHAGEGVGMVTMPGLPIPPGEPAINPVPRKLMEDTVREVCAEYDMAPDIDITISIPGGKALAAKTWNPRLGIKGGLSVLGTTGIVRPFSCAAWIASIHRGVDVARAQGLEHVAGCTGAMSEKAVQQLYGLPDHGMLDMGDFAGGLLKYISKNPIAHVTIGGGLGKLTKLAQGARDLHSGRSQIDFVELAKALDVSDVENMNTALQVFENISDKFSCWVAENACKEVRNLLPESISCDVVVVDRQGTILARAGR